MTQKYQKFNGPWSHKNTRKSLVRGHKNVKNSQVCSPKKCQKCLTQECRKNNTNSQVCRHQKGPKTCKSVVTQKHQKLAGPRSQKMPRTHRSAVTKNAKNAQVSIFVKDHKVAGWRSQKIPKILRSAVIFRNTTNSQVRTPKNLSKTRRLVITQKYQ